jgi:exosortase E/protease (VPEID-CTERM system)
MSSDLTSDRQPAAALPRLLLVVGLGVAEAVTTSLLFGIEAAFTDLKEVQYYVRHVALVAIASTIAFAVISWPKRQTLIEHWSTQIERGSWRQPLAVNLVLFAILVVATIGFSRHVATVDRAPWELYSAYVLLLAATGVSLALLAAPLGFWRTIIDQHRLTMAQSVGAGIAAILLGRIFKAAWNELSGLTLRLSHALLTLYEADARIDYDTRTLGVGAFSVYIDEACSGYEGIGLVLVFLGLYLWVFRGSLRFPNALLLLPIGGGTIWLLNSVRIAALVSIGGHVSPEMAIDGFHSQAGWIAFLIVTIGIMICAPRLAFFATDRRAAPERSPSDRLVVAFLAPFMGLMIASIAMAAVVPFDTWLYGLKVAAVGLCLWIFFDVYRGLMAPVGVFAVLAGVIVGIIWVVTAPGGDDGETIGAWIAAQPVWLAVLWLVIRSIGAIVMVPIAEELAFRGLLHRWIISRDFERVGFAAFTWPAFMISSLLFGLLHQRWIAGALAGAAFALVMYRSGRLSDPIAAHMAANAVVIAWAIAAQNWSLL